MKNPSNNESLIQALCFMPLFQRLWKACLGLLFVVGDYTWLVLRVFYAILRHPPRFRLIFDQFYNIGVASLPVVAITGCCTGLVLAAQSFYQLSDKGLTSVTGLMVGEAMTTELGPVLCGFMLTGRVGAAICAELGSMCITEQVDALRTMHINPYQYLVAPRLIAGLLAMPFLVSFCIAMGVMGGYLISVYFFGMPSTTFWEPMRMHITLFDLFTGLSKSVVFGALIMTIASYKGLRTVGGAAELGKSTTNSVVVTYCAILFANFFLTMGMNAAYNKIQLLLQ